MNCMMSNALVLFLTANPDWNRLQLELKQFIQESREPLNLDNNDNGHGAGP